MEQQTYKTDAAIYDVLEREIIDLTIRPGSSLSENPLCTRFGAPRSLIRVVLQKLQENGLVKIVPYKGTTVTRLNREIVEELIYERTAVEARVLRDFRPGAPRNSGSSSGSGPLLTRLWPTPSTRTSTVCTRPTACSTRPGLPPWGRCTSGGRCRNAHADYSRFRMLDTITSGGLAEVIADHTNLIDAIERCDMAAFEPLVERHLYGGIRRLGSKLTEEYADYFEPEP